VQLALEFPPITHLVEWPDFWFKNSAFGVNKVVLLFWLAAALTIAFFVLGSRERKLVPSALQGLVESTVDFVQTGIIMQTMGPDGLSWTPLLVTLFTFIFSLNAIALFPFIQMPANARMALPVFMALLVWLVYNVVGVMKQGPLTYFKNIMFPPGVPKALYVLVSPIELVSTIIVRPLSLSVRLFANLLAGHLILVTFAVMTDSLVKSGVGLALAPFTFALLVALTGFEVLVAFLHAYIFTILAAVYIGGAMHPEH
jgi:F-type H+-transporting ATPase subunit a